MPEPAAISEIVVEQMDSDLGCWTYASWRPPHLGCFVERLWYSAGTTAVARERLLPNG